ncbi:MAG: HAD hydrolase-like protein [Lachnospiraceae bacterium]|nr:HAD hydrolase-like protein [Lachnospiraceae bacterium]
MTVKENSKNKIKAVIFDLDDTLVSEYAFIVSGYRYMSKIFSERLSLTPDEVEEKLWLLSKESYSNIFNRLFDSCNAVYTDGDIKKWIQEYRNHDAALQFYTDVYPVLCALKEKGILTGIISDGDPDRQRNKINTAIDGLPEGEKRRSASDWFDEIILNDEFGGASYRKPNPHGFRVMAERLGIDPSEMVYIGDNPAKDFHIAAELPVRTCRIIRENGIYIDKPYLDGIEETYRLDRLDDLLEVVGIRCSEGDNTMQAGISGAVENGNAGRSL